jgi:hypothetical protein
MRIAGTVPLFNPKSQAYHIPALFSLVGCIVQYLRSNSSKLVGDYLIREALNLMVRFCESFLILAAPRRSSELDTVM